MKDRILHFLSANHPWKENIHFYDTISSTNDVLKQMGKTGAPHGTVLVAARQTGGRGRLGRTFLSPADVGIYMSVLIRPDCEPSEIMHLTCAAAIAACNAIERATGFRPGIKWTNDLVMQKRKIAGILTELSFNAEMNVDYAIIGIGINCCQKPDDFPEDIRSFAGSLEMVTEQKIDRAKIAAEMINAFSEMDSALLAEKQMIMQDYRKDCITIGQDVSVVKAEQIRHGKALDVDEDGALVVRFPDGTVEAVNSGEVSVRGLYHYV